MRNYHFTAIVEKDEDGYFVYCPELKGCHSQGDTYEEALENIKDAIKLYLEVLLEEKKEISSFQPFGLSTVEVAV